MPKRVTLENISRLPESSWSLPRDELYIQLGCVACPNKTCIKAKGITSIVPKWSRDPEATEDLRVVTDEIDKEAQVFRGSESSWVEECPDPCPQEDEMRAAIELLNVRFDSTLSLGQ